MILREFQQNRDHTLAVVLDLHEPDVPQASFAPTVELALSFVASLLVERGRECHDGYLSLVAAGNKTLRWEGQGHAASLELLFDGLADFESGSASGIVELLSDAVLRSTSSTQILVLTTREGDWPFQHLLSSRVDMLIANQATFESLLVF